MASIGEVARRAGVSITTVSRVLNPVSEYPVAAATRRRVLAAAAALQYSPSALARALVTRRSRMVGVLLGDIADPYFAEIVRGIEDVARRSGYLVVVCNTSRDPGTERRYVTALRDYRADAIIFLGGDIFDAPTRRALERELISLTSYGAVALAVAGDHADLPAIDIDHTAGAEDMVRYLIGLGHARIGYISGPLTVSISAPYTMIPTGYVANVTAGIQGRVNMSAWDFGDGNTLKMSGSHAASTLEVPESDEMRARMTARAVSFKVNPLWSCPPALRSCDVLLNSYGTAFNGITDGSVMRIATTTPEPNV